MSSPGASRPDVPGETSGTGRFQGVLGFCIGTYAALFALLFAVGVLGYVLRIPYSLIMRDPASILDGHPLTGALSNVGILFWCAAATVCFFSAAALRDRTPSRYVSFLRYSGALTTLLLLDDLFMGHEELLPTYLLVPEKGVLGLYALLALAYAFAFRAEIRASAFVLFVLAAGFFAASVGVDQLYPVGPGQSLIEDGLKLIGIASWLLFLAVTCHRRIRLSMA